MQPNRCDVRGGLIGLHHILEAELFVDHRVNPCFVMEVDRGAQRFAAFDHFGSKMFYQGQQGEFIVFKAQFGDIYPGIDTDVEELPFSYGRHEGCAGYGIGTDHFPALQVIQVTGKSDIVFGIGAFAEGEVYGFLPVATCFIYECHPLPEEGVFNVNIGLLV